MDVSVLLKHHVVTGAALAFKTQLREIALPLPEVWPHDAWLAILAATQDGLVAGTGTPYCLQTA